MTTSAAAKALKESNDKAISAWDAEIEKFEALVRTYSADTQALKAQINTRGTK